MENTIILAQKSNALKIINDKLQLSEMQYEFIYNLKKQKEDGLNVQ
jgi:hypothetical protein